MDGREYIDVGEELTGGSSEAHWRVSVGRTYYGLMLECRDALRRWGFVCPSRDNVHAFVRLRFSYTAHADLQLIGDRLDRFGRLRNQADYQLGALPFFASPAGPIQVVMLAREALALLNQIESDPTRRAAAIAAIKAAWP